jgi:hypothetical protein
VGLNLSALEWAGGGIVAPSIKAGESGVFRDDHGAADGTSSRTEHDGNCRDRCIIHPKIFFCPARRPEAYGTLVAIDIARILWTVSESTALSATSAGGILDVGT